MPSVNLRLTDEQHAELVAEAEREQRSLQRQIIHRLFPPPLQTEPHPAYDSERAARPDPKPGKRR
jgi:hypothetical protein